MTLKLFKRIHSKPLILNLDSEVGKPVKNIPVALFKRSDNDREKFASGITDAYLGVGSFCPLADICFRR